jgi:hypothetical protein
MKAAFAKIITDAMIKTRTRNNERMQQHDPVAASILEINGVSIASLPLNKEAVINKITGVEDSWYMLINNSDLHFMSKEDIDGILDSLDYGKYLLLLHDTFEKNWRNMTPEWEAAEKEQKKAAKKKSASNLFDDADAPDMTNVADMAAFSTQSDVSSETAIETPADTVISVTEDEKAVSDANQTGMQTDAVTKETEPVMQNSIIDDIELPRMIRINRPVLSMTDVKNGEKHLAMNGIREIDTHKVLSGLMKVMTDTDIDS